MFVIRRGHDRLTNKVLAELSGESDRALVEKIFERSRFGPTGGQPAGRHRLHDLPKRRLARDAIFVSHALRRMGLGRIRMS